MASPLPHASGMGRGLQQVILDVMLLKNPYELLSNVVDDFFESSGVLLHSINEFRPINHVGNVLSSS